MVKFGSHYYALVKVTALSYLSLSVQALQVTTGRATSVFRDSHCSVATDASTSKLQSRRNVIDATAFSLSLLLPSKAYATGNLSELLAELKKARLQMEPIPDLINTEQWDAVRAILILPPLSNLWTKSARKVPLLQEYADIIGGNNGDELAVLEGKEELMSSLRNLDMAVYNNNFNPIVTMGKTGATPQLIKSYEEDPINAYKASVALLDELIKLGSF